MLSPAAPCNAGIVQGKATVRSVRRQGDFASLSVAFPPGAADGVQIGASVAINGTCLTVGCELLPAACWGKALFVSRAAPAWPSMAPASRCRLFQLPAVLPGQSPV